VLVYSTDQFGGSVISSKDGSFGNGGPLISALNQLGSSNSIFSSFTRYWENWVTSYKEVTNQAPVFETFTTSELGLRLASEWLKLLPIENKTLFEFSPQLLLKSKRLQDSSSLSSEVFWVQAQAGQQTGELAKLFAGLLLSPEKN